MITRLRGELLEVDSNHIVIDVGGVGYEVFMPASFVVQLTTLSNKVDLYIRQIFREDGVFLYGFLEPIQRRIFDLLKEVKGCGPRTSMALLDELGSEGVLQAISGHDHKSLSRASGVGPRLAERITVELKDKVQNELLSLKIPTQQKKPDLQSNPQEELVDALISLGYKRYDAEVAAIEAQKKASTLEEQIRIALRSLQR